LLALAQAAERVEQGRILIVRDEPPLCDLELARRIRRAALRVDRQQARVPVSLETAGQEIGRLAIRAQ